MALTVESLNFDKIRAGNARETGDAIEFLWQVINDNASRERRAIRLAVDRSERLNLDLAPTSALNNYDIGNASIVTFTGSTAVNVTGLLAPSGSASRLVTLLVLGSATITVKHSSASSEEPNRILTFSAGDLAIATNKAVNLLYRDSRWRELKWA